MCQEQNANEKLLTAVEIAQVLNLTTQAVHRYARLNRLPTKRLGRQVRFALSEVLSAMGSERQVENGSPKRHPMIQGSRPS
jgi:excisionase family DNA binding protein